MTIDGRCHCGNIAFSLAWDPLPAEIPARACGCTFCLKHGGLWTSNPKGSLDVRIADRARVRRYAFGTRTAEFHICAACGVVPVVTSVLDGRTYGVVSVHAFEGIDRSRIRSAPMDYEGEALEARVARRKRNWIPEVRFS